MCNSVCSCVCMGACVCVCVQNFSFFVYDVSGNLHCLYMAMFVCVCVSKQVCVVWYWEKLCISCNHFADACLAKSFNSNYYFAFPLKAKLKLF